VLDTRSEAASRGAGNVFNCPITAAVWNSTAIPDPAKLRAQVAAAFPATLSSGVLKQADEQNLCALLALKQALQQSGLSADQCANWGLVAVPRSPCRRRVSKALARFREQGAWCVSPHLIPHASLHCASGLFSQALRLYGPNIGAGGVSRTESEGVWAAISLLEGEQLPGVWLILTGWETETLSADVRCQAAILGLQTRSHVSQALLTVTPSMESRSAPSFSLESLGASIRTRTFGNWDIGSAVCAVAYPCAEREAAA
jgi:hypothetical protein